MKPISIVIITYNRPDDLLNLLKNIASQQEAETLAESIIIINNASTLNYDAVTDFIGEQRLPFQYVYSTENLGVARGRNKGIALAKAPVIVTIDDDAYFKTDDALIAIEQLFASLFAKENNIGVFCFKVFYPDGTLQANAFPHKKMEKYINKERFLTSYFIGCGHAVLQKVYDEAGPYPTDFFYGMEEYDLGYRILDLGYSMAYDSSVEIIHNESPAGRTTHADKMKMMWINKSKVAYRYLPITYYITTCLMWSLQFLKKTNWNFRLWIDGWEKIFGIPHNEKREVISNKTLNYIKQVEGRLWY